MLPQTPPALRPQELLPAIAAVAQAAGVCRHVQRDLERLRSMTKDDRSPVTVADFAAQAVVARALVGMGGGRRLVAEESADFLRQPDHSAHLEATVVALRESGAWADAAAADVLGAIEHGAGEPHGADSDEPWWTLDPIDGTKGFLRGQQYAVALACLVRGQVVFGVMACPNLSVDPAASVDEADARGSMYVAARGGGVTEFTLGRPDGRRLPEHVDAGGRAPVLAESVDAGHSDQSLSPQVMSAAAGPAGEYGVVRLDSQAKYVVVARGQADVYLRLPTRKGYVERIWDHAAGALIAQEAGCIVTDAMGRELDFSRGRGLEGNRGVVVARPGLHPRIIEATRRLFAAT